MNDPLPPPSSSPLAEAFGNLPPLSRRRMAEVGLIRAQGPEARSFLQSQLSNDLTQVSSAQAQLAGYCGPKGRLLAVFTVSQLESADSFGLESPAELLPATLKRLRMFVLRSKLLLEDVSSEWPALALAGPEAAACLKRLHLDVPDEPMSTAISGGVLVQRRPGAWPRYRLRASPERLATIEAALSEVPPMEAGLWSLGELVAGVPVVRAATVEHFVPQTVDLDLAGGISFTKGCYPGQEIVARVHYLGRLKQRLHLARCDEAAQPGQPVVASQGDGQAVGEVMDCAPLPRGGYLLGLALQLDRAAEAELRLGGTTGPALTDVHPAGH